MFFTLHTLDLLILKNPLFPVIQSAEPKGILSRRSFNFRSVARHHHPPSHAPYAWVKRHKEEVKLEFILLI
ncbi:hypothetical protein L2E82_45077 [Cichorium intybus]|uniref:Uncharacterized protein n=1 Tax=Cichorium intybus TaxID=13427 RepID=A0ACB8ZS85_CICIN|nr:hypothetical protein L2E82_45077 [Cichorium intybus]